MHIETGEGEKLAKPRGKVVVVRTDGEEKEMAVEDLRVGDVLKGDKRIPAGTVTSTQEWPRLTPVFTWDVTPHDCDVSAARKASVFRKMEREANANSAKRASASGSASESKRARKN